MIRLVFLLVLVAFPAYAHEHTPGETPEQAEVTEFLRTWHRPTGNFKGLEHRAGLCCYIGGEHQDCFAIEAVRVRNGVREVFPDSEGHPEYARWYPVNTGVDEDLQPDPRDSPDGRSYVCIVGQQIACLVWGSGM